MIPAAISRKLLLAALALVALPATAPAQTLPVTSKATFDQAVASAQPGDVIALADVSYPPLQVKRSFELPGVTISGSRAARLGGLELLRTSYVTVRGVTVTPTPGRSWSALKIEASQHVVVDDILVDGISQEQGAWVKVVASSSNVTLQDSELTRCGEGERCLGPGGSNLTIRGNWFHDCENCDFLRGGGSQVTIEGNTFERALRGPCSGTCHHNDLVQIMGGVGWTLRGNVFGARSGGAAQLFVNPNAQQGGQIRDVLIEANRFEGPDMAYAITIAGQDNPNRRPPAGVRIKDNTVLTGTLSSLRLAEAYAGMAPADRPVVTNNSFAKLKPKNCPLGTFEGNVVQAGSTCAP